MQLGVFRCVSSAFDAAAGKIMDYLVTRNLRKEILLPELEDSAGAAGRKIDFSGLPGTWRSVDPIKREPERKPFLGENSTAARFFG